LDFFFLRYTENNSKSDTKLRLVKATPHQYETNAFDFERKINKLKLNV